ncbi:MAG: hypothetical protein JO058_03170 [Alphaproteobacteria bacterium]|nr:hypothetical protein [Alphaproteobacteria bacterium]
MKHLLNLPLGIAALLQARFAYLALMPGPWPGWGDGPSRGAMAFIMLEAALLAWLPLVITGAGAVFTDAFDWTPPVRRGRRRALMLAAVLVVALTIAMCMVVALASSEAVGGSDFKAYRLLVPIAALGGSLGPFALMAWLAWLINAPAPLRHAVWPRRAVFAMLAATVVSGGIIGLDSLRQEIAAESKLAASYRSEENQNEAENAAHFASLTDASPLHSWGAYATNTVYYADRFRRAEDEMKETALRRLAARPTLEADLAKDLVSSDDSYRDSDIAFLLVARVEFTPTAALETPLRSVMTRIGAEMRKASFGDKWPTKQGGGEDEILDSYIKSGFAERLTASVAIARRMAAGPGVDLRDALHELQATASAAYPNTRTAATYQRDVAAADREIAAALIARRKPD